MKITSDVFEVLMRAVSVGKLMGIDSIAMEENDKGKMFRGMTDSGGTPVVLLQHIDIELPFAELGVTDAKSFITKEKLAHTNDSEYTIYAQIDEMTNSVVALNFKGHKFKMSINAAKTRIIRAPKAMKDVDVMAIQLEDEEVTTLQLAISAFPSAELIDVVSDGDSIHLELQGKSVGSFEFHLENDPLELNGGCSDGFVHSYPVKTFINLLKHSESKTIKIGQMGILSSSIQDIQIYVFPRRL